jgi:hypothetical protein
LAYALALLLSAAPGPDALATDSLREAQIAAELDSPAAADEMLQLDAAGGKFSALYRAAIPRERKGGILLFSGADHSPNAVETVQSLRKRLPERGWDSLSLQAPVREQGAGAAEYRELTGEAAGRLAAGVAYLKTKGAEPIVLVGYRLGGASVLRHLAENPDGPVAAAVLIDLTGTTEDQAEIVEALAKIKVPLLDIFGRREQALADDLSLGRKRVLNANPRSRQIIIADSTTGLEDVRELLANRIHGWLSRLGSR